MKEKNKREYILIIGSAALLLTHTVITMYVALICLIYLITQYKKLKNKKVRNKIIFSLLLIIVITSFFWAPLLEHKISADYEVFKSGRMERTDVLIAFKLYLSELIITNPNSIMIYDIGILNIILLIITPFILKKTNKKWKHTDYYYFYLFSIVMGIISCVMTLKIFPFEKLPSIFKMLQFSFRLLEFSSFFFAFVVATNMAIILKKIRYKDILCIIVLLMVLTSIYNNRLIYRDNFDETKLWPAVPVTESTGRVHAGCASFEYLPSKAFENRKYIENRTDEVLILNGYGQVSDYIKENTNLTCKLTNVVETTQIELPYIYYLGYEVTIEQDGKIIKLDTYETENGFVGVTLPGLESAKLELSHTGTFVMKLTAVISILGTIFLIVYYKKLLTKK